MIHIISATAFTDGTQAFMCWRPGDGSGPRLTYADAVAAGHVVGNYTGTRGATCPACIAAADGISHG